MNKTNFTLTLLYNLGEGFHEKFITVMPKIHSFGLTKGA